MLFELILLAAATFGLSCLALRRLPFAWYVPELLAHATLLAVLLSGWVMFLPACWLPYDVSARLGAFLMVGILLMVLCCRGWGDSNPPLRWVGRASNRRFAWSWFVFTLLGSSMISFYFYNAELPPNRDWVTTVDAWQDMGLHMSLVAFWNAHPQHFVATLPISYNTPLPYHFMMDFISTMCYRAGLPLGLALLLPMLALGLAMLQGLFFVTWRLWRSPSACLLASYLMLFGGSTWGLHYFWVDLQHRGDTPAWRFIMQNSVDYTDVWDKGLFFSNLVTSSLLPQRPSVFGYCALAFVCLIVIECAHRPERKMLPGLVTAGVITGLMPLAHFQGSLMCLGLMVWNTLLASVRQRRLVTPWTGALGCALLLWIPQVVWLKSMQSTGHRDYMVPTWMWMTDRHQCFLTFYAENLGPAFYFIWLAVRKLYERRPQILYRLYLPTVVAFIIANFVLLQPAPYDNIKVIFYVYVIACSMAGWYLVRQFMKGPWATRIVTVLLVLVWTGSGLLAHIREVNGVNTELLNFKDVDLGEDMAKVMPPDAVVACLPDLHSPISMVTGRQIIMGYVGFVNSYGLDWMGREHDLQTILAGGPDAEKLIRQYHVTFVVGDRANGSLWKFNYDWFGEHYRTIHDDPRWVIYRLDVPK